MKSNCPRSLFNPFALMALAWLLASPMAMAQNATVESQAPPDSPRTLEALVAEALEKNPELKFYEAEIAAAKAGRKTAGLLANPQLSGDAGHNAQKSGVLNSEGVAWSVSVIQPFEWPGRMGLRKAIANQDIELAQLGYERFKIALAGRIRSLAYGLFVAQEKSAAATEVAERFQALREILVQRDPAGLTPLLETRVIEATELNAQRKASEAGLSAQSALLELNQLRGAPPDEPLTLDRTPFTFLPPPRDRNGLLALARTNNFELRVRAAELAQQGFRVNLARNERFPTLGIGPSYSDQRAGPDEQRILGIGVTLPLPLWNRNQGNIQAATARQVQAEVSLNTAGREIQRKVIEAAMTYDSKLREMAKWRPDAIQHFKEAAGIADRHYRLGAVPVSTYVELQKQYLDAVESLLDTKKQALDAAAQLEVLTGLPMPRPQISTPTEEKK